MDRVSKTYEDFCKILKEELIPAQGCTEPIALALCASRCREILGEIPDKIIIEVSGSIIKNVKSVIVPNTGKLRGIEAAVAAGIIIGDSSKKLECIAQSCKEDEENIHKYLKTAQFEVTPLLHDKNFDIVITEKKGPHYAKVRITNYHTNIVLEEIDNKILLKNEIAGDRKNDIADRSQLNIQNIWDFTNSFHIDDIKDALDRQIKYNMAISEEGLKHKWGANIGSSILYCRGCCDTKAVAKAYAAAGSDARMSGCELPVVCNSGSGNQGITCSVPVIVYARDYKIEKNKLYRALVLSNLCAIHQKDGIGRLSAYCGAVSAAAAAGAGIAYLIDGGYDAVFHTLVASLAIASGMVCDGATTSCAAKIAISLEAAFLALDMYFSGNCFCAGEGLVTEEIEDFINNIAKLGKVGMYETNKEIIKLITNKKILK